MWLWNWSLTLREEHKQRVLQMLKSRRMGWAGHVAHLGERRGTYRVLVCKSERKETTWET